MKSEAEGAVRAILDQVMTGKLTANDAVAEIVKVTTSQTALRLVERRQWKRKEFLAEGTLSITYGLDQRRVSRAEKVLVTNISAGGVKIEGPFLSLDGLHIVGDLSEEVWMPNILNLEVPLPAILPARIGFQGSAEWYLRTGTEPYYVVGVAIDVISLEHNDLLLRFLLAEGSS